MTQLFNRVMEYAENHGGQIYAPIGLPGYESIPVAHPESLGRIDEIISFFPEGSRSVCDLGAHWGYASFALEDLGYSVEAVEHSSEHLWFLEEIKKERNSSITVRSEDILGEGFTVEADIILALNLFHHFLKGEERFRKFETMLPNLRFNTLIFQSHNPKEGQMRDAFWNPEPEEFASFIAEKSAATDVSFGGIFRDREFYVLYCR